MLGQGRARWAVSHKSELIQKINALDVRTTVETYSRIELVTHNFRNGQSLYCGKVTL